MTIRRMISRGQLAAYRLGNRLIKIRVADLDALMSPIGAA
jgi:excisionase family DNA binding protein